MTKLTAWAAATLVVTLSACGGGGGGSSTTTGTTPTVAVTAEGFWNGTTTNGVKFALAILETGETWGLYTSNGSLIGAIYGNTASSGTSITGTLSAFNFVTRTSASDTFKGDFSAKSSLSLTLASDATKATAAYDASYDQPASLAVLAGTYTGFAVTAKTAAQSTPVTISSSGAITAGSAVSCLTTGTAIPRASGKNILDVRLSFTGSNCALGNGTTISGMANYDSTSRNLVLMAFNSTKTDGVVYIGQR